MANLTNFTTTKISISALVCNCCNQQTVEVRNLAKGQRYVCNNCGQSEIVLYTGQDIAVAGNAANSITAILGASPAQPAPAVT